MTYENPQTANDLVPQLINLLGNKALMAQQQPTWAPQGDPWAMMSQQDRPWTMGDDPRQPLQPGQSMMPQMAPPAPVPQQMQGGGLVDQITQFMMHPLTQGMMGAVGGALSQRGRQTGGQRFGNAMLGGITGAEAATRTGLYQQQVQAQAAHQQQVERVARAEEERKARQEAISTRLLNSLPEQEQAYAIYPGARPKVDMSVTEGDLAYKAVNDPSEEGRGKAKEALQLLQGIKSKERSITKDRLAWEAENAGSLEEREQAKGALKRLQDMEMEIEKSREAGRDRRAALRGARDAAKDAKDAARDKKDTQTQLLSEKRVYLAQRSPEEKEEKVDENKYRQWLKDTAPSLYEDAIRHKLIPPVTAAPQGGGTGATHRFNPATGKAEPIPAAGAQPTPAPTPAPANPRPAAPAPTGRPLSKGQLLWGG